jgi:C4-dicarboxylate-specific signal transduction histidine kinase
VERRRAEELLRLGQVARLNTLGELAAGMAHELNQPLTALLANTQAVSRLLRDEPPDLALVQRATDDAVQQARRAADVVGRLRRAVERPDVRTIAQPMALEQPLRSALHLLEPEFRRRQVLTQVESDGAPQVMADPVAVEQIVHNLLMNALHALEQVPVDARRIRLWLGVEQGQGVLRVTDSGPGIAADVLPRLFQPFFSTRPGGMGLGLSLCETLATGMGGALTAANAEPRGAVFTLQLPLVMS